MLGYPCENETDALREFERNQQSKRFLDIILDPTNQNLKNIFKNYNRIQSNDAIALRVKLEKEANPNVYFPSSSGLLFDAIKE